MMASISDVSGGRASWLVIFRLAKKNEEDRPGGLSYNAER
jgi:hypothetical protein